MAIIATFRATDLLDVLDKIMPVANGRGVELRVQYNVAVFTATDEHRIHRVYCQILRDGTTRPPWSVVIPTWAFEYLFHGYTVDEHTEIDIEVRSKTLTISDGDTVLFQGDLELEEYPPTVDKALFEASMFYTRITTSQNDLINIILAADAQDIQGLNRVSINIVDGKVRASILDEFVLAGVEDDTLVHCVDAWGFMGGYIAATYNTKHVLDALFACDSNSNSATLTVVNTREHHILYIQPDNVADVFAIRAMS